MLGRKREPEEHVTNAKFGSALESKMKEKGLTIYELAKKTDSSYETMRRILRGMNLPSLPRLRMICAEVGWDFEEAKNLKNLDEVQNKYGSVETSGILRRVDTDLQHIIESWTTLSPAQKDVVVAQLDLYLSMGSEKIRKSYNSSSR
jgi:transcriptional regulator with XRE-family HTH domain